MPSKYDQTDPKSIEKFATRLLQSTLRKEIFATVETKGKGGFGQVLEKGYFEIDPGNSPEPDFSGAGVELKSFPLKKLKNGQVVAKERMALSMIDYEKVVGETWENCSVMKKNALLLLVAYMHDFDPEVNFMDYVIKIAQLWEFPEEDLKIIRDDWNEIVRIIKEEGPQYLSEGRTMYLGAVTKASTSKDRRAISGAKPRAFSLKQPYLTKIVQRILGKVEEVAEPAVTNSKDYQDGETFESLVARKFQPYIGKSIAELREELGVTSSLSAKNYVEVITRAALGVKTRHIEEFDKAGIKMKTIRLQRNGIPKESMSFSSFRFRELAEEEWETSTLRERLSQRFFFVVFKEDEHGELRLCKVKFWTMPVTTLDGEVYRVWTLMQKAVRESDPENFPKGKNSPILHVRPHGKNKADVDEMPDGSTTTKRCFWLRNTYVAEQVK